MTRFGALLACVVASGAALGCAGFKESASDADAGPPPGAEDGAPPADGARDAGADTDATARDATTEDAPSDPDAGADVTASDAGADTATPDAGIDSGLDPQLVVPPPGEPPCDPVQGDAQCASGRTCRIASATGGTCDAFTSNAIAGFPCTVDSDCDYGIQCYRGKCHVMCPLGANCAGGCACFMVGNDSVGLCCPGL